MTSAQRLVTAQQKCLERHFQKVVKLGHGNDTVLGKPLDLIDEAFSIGNGAKPRIGGLRHLGFWIQVTVEPEHPKVD